MNTRQQFLASILARATRGMTPLERALRIVEILRNVYGNDWIIEADGDGGFVLKKR